MKPFFPTWRIISRKEMIRPFALSLFILFLSSVVLAQKQSPASVVDSILGVGIGTHLEEAHKKLDPLRVSTKESPREEEKENEREEEAEGGRKEAWTLRRTNFASVVLQANREGRVVWITAWLRPGREMPFAKFGNLSKAQASTSSRALWNVSTSNGGYRLVVKGLNGKARIVSLFALATDRLQ